jgi:glyceraldehyde 3-phosphate dehydrogenase
MTVKVGINGFGRIGRNFFRAAKRQGADLDFVAVNDITDAKTLAHLLKYDSVLGTLDADIGVSNGGITVDGDELKVLAERDPAALPWKELGAEIVIESTGLFTDRESAEKHLEAGAQKVVVTAPAKGEDITVVLGVNQDDYDPATHHVISNASCTTNPAGPGRGHQHRAREHWGGQGDVAGHPQAQGEDGRHGVPGPGPCRLGDRPCVSPGAGGHGGGDQRGVQGRC